jgi:hypothetical protein
MTPPRSTPPIKPTCHVCRAPATRHISGPTPEDWAADYCAEHPATRHPDSTITLLTRDGMPIFNRSRVFNFKHKEWCTVTTVFPNENKFNVRTDFGSTYVLYPRQVLSYEP